MRVCLSPRCLKVGEEIKRSLATLLQEPSAIDPMLEGVSLTITETQMSTDVKTARIFLLPLAGKNKGQIIHHLNENKSKIRKLLAKKVYLKHIPQLIFVLDDRFHKNDRINSILKQDTPNSSSNSPINKSDE
ncbi:MAG: ribosome-binding factor A [Rickettsiales bacterium]|nr:ribosome-binding factor A [Rickettsiales bacterium]|tara:strand:- start:10954 stop:11349 length:396 start_codon:yes stop_codon:yes gene_type:complete